MTKKVALVTGASSGIGAATARALVAAGYTVVGAARRMDRLGELAVDGVDVVQLDITDSESVQLAVTTTLDRHGRIDVLVNNAGYGSYGSLEDVPIDEGRRQLEVNVLGLAELTQAVIPTMRAQRAGRIINISSMGGRFATPLGAWYHASKYAVEGISDALRLELAPFGIDVVVIEPGSIVTEWGSIAAENLLATSGSGPYQAAAEAVAKSLASSSQEGARMTSPPSVIAKSVVTASTAKRPRTRYRVGFGAAPMTTLSAVLPDRTFDSIIKRVFALPA